MERDVPVDKDRRTEPVWRLPPDVVIKPVEELTAWHLEQIAPDGNVPQGHFAIERKKVRALPKIVNKDVVDVLRAFGEKGATYGDVLERFVRERNIARDELHPRMQKMVKDFVNSSYLVAVTGEADGDDSRIEPSFKPGDAWLSYRILENVHCIIDSEIYKIEDAASGELRALKITQRTFPNGEMRDKVMERLRQEFAFIETLDHPNIVKVWRYGEHDGRTYGILDWVDGPTVRRYAYRSETPPADEKLMDLACECLEALMVVHGAGYLHGDVHTGNFLIRGGHVCLIDFGLARPINVEREDERRYIEGGVIQYMPPEYVQYYFDKRKGLWGSVAGEIYSCGVMLFALFTKMYPYRFSFYRDEYMKHILNDPPSSFAESSREPWPDLECVLHKALAKNPSDRYESAAAFLKALKAVRMPDEHTA